jgi:TonB family protein
VENYFTPPKPAPAVTPDLTRVERSTRPRKDKIKVNLARTTRTASNNSPSQPNNASNARAINNAIRSLSHSLSSATRIDMPGNASAAYASYASVIKSVYEQALRSQVPEQVASEKEYTKVSIIVANDGSVLSSRIISPSGDPGWDNAVQRTLDQVTFIAPFPDGATEKERHYTLSFNPEVEQSFE